MFLRDLWYAAGAPRAKRNVSLPGNLTFFLILREPDILLALCSLLQHGSARAGRAMDNA